MWIRCAAALLWVMAAAAPAATPLTVPARGIDGIVTSVVDGDSVWVTPGAKGSRDGKPGHAGKAIEVRLAGIDAPEICQEGGPEAKAFLAELVLKQPVRLVVAQGGSAHDVHGRTLGTLWLGEVEVNRRLVEEGHAWSERIKWDRGPYVPQERMAKALSRGVHRVGSAAIMPRDFRQRHGPCK